MENKLAEIIKRYEEIEALIIQPEIIGSQSRYASLMKEHGGLAKFVERIKALDEIRRHKKEAQELISQHQSDKDFIDMTNEELAMLTEKEKNLMSDLEEMFLVNEERGDRNVIMEIRAGTGCDESALFTADLFRMYTKYADRQGWKCLLMDSSPTGLGGFKEVVFSIEGENVYKNLRFESGGHRVQRGPKTEASGRIPTPA